MAIMAIHGGWIEPGTSQIASAIAGDDYSYYSFEGINRKNNFSVHIPSTEFDEPLATMLAETSKIVVCIHGCKSEQEVVFIGGLHHYLINKMKFTLKRAGFSVADHPKLRGISRKNICNRGMEKRGLQLEISRGLREKFFDNALGSAILAPTLYFHFFVRTIRGVLKPFA